MFGTTFNYCTNDVSVRRRDSMIQSTEIRDVWHLNVCVPQEWRVRLWLLLREHDVATRVETKKPDPLCQHCASPETQHKTTASDGKLQECIIP